MAKVKIGNLKFKDLQAISKYKKVLLRYHYTLQKSKCCYCENVCIDPDLDPNKYRTNKKSSTLEHLTQVWETRQDKNFRGLRAYGDISVDNTRLACFECNSTRPQESNWLEWKTKRMKEAH